MSSDPIFDAIIRLFNEFREFDPKAHSFCPKIDDDDVTNYADLDVTDEDGGATPELKKKRVEESHMRAINAYNLTLLLVIPREDASTWLEDWKTRVEHFLTSCDECARSWHKSRERFLGALEAELASERVDYLQKALNEFDKQRIDKGLKKARAILEEHGPMSSSKLVDHDVSAVLALFEALCCMPYLSLPQNREDFNYVFEKTQQKRPLRMQGGIIPTMVFFLWDENPYRRRFAEAAWDRLEPDSLSEEDWDWAVCPQLTAAITSTSLARGSPTPEKVTRFWMAIPRILRSMSEQRILESLRAMEVNPSLYILALEHLGTNSDEALIQVLKGLQALMEKSHKAFWAAYDQVTPIQLIEEIFKSPAFRLYLDRSLLSDRMVPAGSTMVPVLAAWMRALIRSLPLTRRSDAVESLLRHLFENFGVDQTWTMEARATCILAGLTALSESLDGFLQSAKVFDTGTSLIMVNQLLNRVVQYRQVIIDAAYLKPGDIYNIGRSQTAMTIIQSALALDTKATWTEWNALTEDLPVQEAVTRDSGALWEAFLELLWGGQVDLAKAMLLATMPLRSIEQFIPKRKEKLTKLQEQFNQRYQRQTAAIGKMFNRLSDFNPADLDMFCSESQSQTIHPIVASLIHGEEGIRELGFELVKTITGEDRPSEAVNKMLEAYFCPFLDAFSGAVNIITNEKDSHSPWTHMHPTLECSEFILNGLSDPSEGQLRLKTLTPNERAVVKRWWETAWRVVGHSFRMMRTWHVKVDKKVMEDFCRDVMELAEKFLAQDGLMASALSTHTSGQLPSQEELAESMKGVLEAPRLNSYNLVDMLQLRDRYLIQGIIETIKKLLARLKENDMVLPPKTIAALNNMVKKKRFQDGRVEYVTKTNLTNEERIELLKAMGEDAEIEQQFIGTRTSVKEAREREAAKRQSKLDFSKAGTTSYVKDHISSITPNFEKSEKRRSALETLKAAAPPPKPDQKTVLANQASIKEKRARERAEIARRNAEAIAKAKALRAPTKLVPGEGSGLAGVTGVQGKELTPAAKDEIMVGSSSEEEDDSDDEIIKKHTKAGQKMDEAQRRKMRLLAEQRGPVKKQKLQRSAKDMRARLIPPMDVLHQAILEWDIFHEGNDPPNGYRCAAVLDSYTDPRSYKEAFFPLLINEAWRSFVTAKDETTSKPFGIKVLSRMSVDKFMEITASVPAQVGKDRGLSEGDIVILSKAENPLNQPDETHCLARIWKTTFKKDVIEVVYRLNAKGNQILPVLLPGGEFYVVKITNMTTIEREYAALESLQYYDLMDEVLKAEPSPMLKFGDDAIRGVMENYTLNLGQAKAILNAKENDGFTLVQGPPGTGKTKTIVAMVGCLLSNVLKNASNPGVALPRAGLPQSNNANAGTTKKLLVCAPSNAAVDELVLRLKQGVKTMNGQFHKINVIRLGRSDAINAAVRDVTLDELVKEKVNGAATANSVSDREKLHQEAAEIKQRVNELYPPLEAARASDNRELAMKLQRELDELKKRRAHIGARIDADKSSGNTFAREAEIKRRQVQQQILDNAQVLCATLSGSGHEMFKNLNVEFETVIIDEAAQCVELSALIPLKYGCSKCILVGDPKQLPPTVLSQSAAKYGYDQSLFVRMQKNHAKEVHLLDMQYRMHPEISQFPSREFYEGLLQDGADMGQLRLQPWHQSALLGPYRFFDVKGSQSRGPKNQSLVNEEELNVAMRLYHRFKSDYHDIDLKGKIGIITPYKAQLYRLRQRFADRYGEGINEEIEFNTTDAFQGRECEIIIFSCVRASPTGGIGFMTDIRRMNVGLTRAKSSLWILGDSRALVQGEFWNKLIEDAKRRDRYTSGDIMGMLNRPGAKLSVAALSALGTSSNNSGVSSAASTPREVIELNDDVEMVDAPMAMTIAPVSQRPPPPPPTNNNNNNNNNNKANIQQQSYQQQSPPRTYDSAPPPLVQNRGPRAGGFNERGEATSLPPRGVGLPVIQTSTASTKKRGREDGNGEGGSGNKKSHHHNQQLNSNQPTSNQQSYRPPPSDPSAMEVLGLVPPQRPPAVLPQRPPPTGPAAMGSGPGVRPPGGGGGGGNGGARPPGPRPIVRPPRKSSAPDMFIKRKPNKK